MTLCFKSNPQDYVKDLQRKFENYDNMNCAYISISVNSSTKNYYN